MEMFSGSACAQRLQFRRFMELKADSKPTLPSLLSVWEDFARLSLGAGDGHFLSSFPLVILTRTVPPLTALEHFLLFRQL